MIYIETDKIFWNVQDIGYWSSQGLEEKIYEEIVCPKTICYIIIIYYHDTNKYKTVWN
jgi:hypothetical protein